MQEQFEMNAGSGRYSVSIESRSALDYIAGIEDSIVLADSFFKDASWLCNSASREILWMDASETTKSLEAISPLVERVRQSGANRQTHFVAVGGGAVQDVTGFVSSVYMRGVGWSYLPTTILSMVDSCIGGKSSINVGPYKNLVGTFHPPKRVLIAPELAETLPPREQASGLIEAAKICFCHSLECFRNYLQTAPAPGMKSRALAGVISRSLLSKKWFIEIDEFDHKERLLLNFGHTFGHAIEGASHYRIPHGIAVGLGMLCALAFARYSCNDCYDNCPEVRLLEEHIHSLLQYCADLSETLVALDLDEMMDRFASDKKHRKEAYVLVLVEASGEVRRKQIDRCPGSLLRCRRAVESVIAACTRPSMSARRTPC